MGAGYVGSALINHFKKQHTVYVNDIDPTRGAVSKQFLMENCNMIFVCVPTPIESGKYDLTILKDVVSELDGLQKKTVNHPLVVLKSTMPPFTTDMFREDSCLRLACNPEFLTVKNASRDMAFPDRVVVGCDAEDTAYFLELFRDEHIFFMSAVEAELVKLLSNAFLVFKVAFSQVADAVCGEFAADSFKVLSAVGADRRVGFSHLNPLLGRVPVDSLCLPKDFAGLVGALRGCEGLGAGVFGLLELVRCFGLESE